MVRTTSVGILLISLAACSSGQPSTPAEAPPPLLVSGIDRSSFDTSVRPQDDVFRYVNGAWLARTEIPADKSTFGTIDRVADAARANLRTIAEDAAKAASRPPGSDAQKIGDFYESFMNEARVDELGITPLQGEFAAIEKIASKADLARYMARLFKLNVGNPILGYVDADAQEPRHRHALSLPRRPRPAGSRLLLQEGR